LEEISSIDLVSYLLWGKRFDQLTEEQGTGTFLRDEGIQLASSAAGSMFLDPIFAPIENRFRRLFRLDNFNINPGFFDNMVKNEIWKELDGGVDYSTIFNSSILLNNLSVDVGKYVNKDFFLEYQLLFQEVSDVTNNTHILLNNTFGVRYDLPFKYKIKYSYEIKPRTEPNAHEILVSKQWRF
jgi:hypothetical protein